MVPNSPADALGSQTHGLRDLIVEVVRKRHNLASDAHQVSESRYAMGFGSQWRDLLDDIRDALRDRGFRSYKLHPGGHEIPVVNDCLVYLWRVPNNPDAVSEFASSPTRKNGFTATPLDPMLLEPSLVDDDEPDEGAVGNHELERVVRSIGETMPLVLVMVRSTPRQLQSIAWAVAMLDDDDKLQLCGEEGIWEPEFLFDETATNVEPFDGGTPVAPVVEVQNQNVPRADA